MNTYSPIVVEVHRGSLLESRHRVHAVIASANGEIVEAWGDAAMEIYPRSAIKPLQALAFLETGAAEAHGCSDEEVALSCASHSGAMGHTMAVGSWLERIGLGPENLRTGTHRPYDEEAADNLIRRDEPWTTLNSNCSGKHSGFLTTARHLGEPLDSYLDIDHPVQRRCRAVLEEMGGNDLTDTARGIDGCGIPVYGMALDAFARATARLADPGALEPTREAACRRITHAMTKHPYMVAGRARFDTICMQALRGRVACKTGAEGVHMAAIPTLGLGVALKAEDGTKRASDTAMAALLDHLGVVEDAADGPFGDFLRPKIINVAGRDAGFIRASLGSR